MHQIIDETSQSNAPAVLRVAFQMCSLWWTAWDGVGQPGSPDQANTVCGRARNYFDHTHHRFWIDGWPPPRYPLLEFVYSREYMCHMCGVRRWVRALVSCEWKWIKCRTERHHPLPSPLGTISGDPSVRNGGDASGYAICIARRNWGFESESSDGLPRGAKNVHPIVLRARTCLDGARYMGHATYLWPASSRGVWGSAQFKIFTICLN